SNQRKVFYGPLDGSAPPIPTHDIDPSSTQALWLESKSILHVNSGKQWALYSMKEGSDVRGPSPFDPHDSTRTYFLSSVLPGDRGALLRVVSYQKGVFRQDIGVLDLKSGKTKILLTDGGSPNYASTGHLLFTRGGTLLAAPFDLGRLEVRGEPVAILGGLRANSNWSHANFELARNGTLLCGMGGAAIQGRHAVILNDDGSLTEWSGEHQPFERKISVSPDGKRFASVITSADALYEIWISTRGNPTSERVIAVPGVDCDEPLWSPDGRHIAYTQTSESPADGVYEHTLGSREPARPLCALEARDQRITLASWLPDGSQILCVLFNSISGDAGDVAVLDVPPPGGRPARLRRLDLGGGIPAAAFSPDGTKLAYIQAVGSGKTELFTRDYKKDGTLGAPVQLSRGGARIFAWMGPRNLIYGNDRGQGLLASVPGPEGSVKPSLVAFPDIQKYRSVANVGAVLPDGRVLLIQRGDDEDDLTRLDVVFNFFDLLKEKLQRK
ncbi:MAG TPA: hypothetical protein VJX91_10125, partial [Candidatus Eisenbacteria bacterium]|nr:hypothetical protein [Candidatus Eisenbacteria bacterium]